MVTVLDTKLLPKVKSILDKYGRDATFYAAPTGYSPTTGTASAGGSLGAAKVSPLAYDVRLMDKDLIQEGDCGVVLAGSGLAFTPAVNMRVVVGSTSFHIVATKRYDSGEQTCAWALHLRGS
ncbi:MAG TPA: hypothetical protein VFD43_12135 [Planctomycetota bacterium]|nr:hypothetical protein [Planctomycetota bacterium]